MRWEATRRGVQIAAQQRAGTSASQAGAVGFGEILRRRRVANTSWRSCGRALFSQAAGGTHGVPVRSRRAASTSAACSPSSAPGPAAGRQQADFSQASHAAITSQSAASSRRMRRAPFHDGEVLVHQGDDGDARRGRLSGRAPGRAAGPAVPRSRPATGSAQAFRSIRSPAWRTPASHRMKR